jgi:hypothetical protein
MTDYSSGVVTAVFGGEPIEPPPLNEIGKPGGGPANRRAELWSNLKQALQGRSLFCTGSNAMVANNDALWFKCIRCI